VAGAIGSESLGGRIKRGRPVPPLCCGIYKNRNPSVSVIPNVSPRMRPPRPYVLAPSALAPLVRAPVREVSSVHLTTSHAASNFRVLSVAHQRNGYLTRSRQLRHTANRNPYQAWATTPLPSPPSAYIPPNSGYVGLASSLPCALPACRILGARSDGSLHS